MTTVETPMMPQALEAEAALLGCILIDPEALLVLKTLKSTDFYREAHAVLFATMQQLAEDGLAVDEVTVTTRLERTGQLERAGGAAYVSGLVNAVPTSQNLRHYADLVKKAAEGRALVAFGGDIVSIGYHSSDPARAAARVAETLVAAASEDGPDLSEAEARARLEALAPGLYYADELQAQTFSEPQWVVPDLLPEGLTLLAAKPKLGKSWLALGLGLAVAAGTPALGRVPVQQGPVLYLALEDSPKRLRKRIADVLGGQPAPHALSLGTEWPRLDQGGLRLLEVWLLAHRGARLIILDTLAKIRGQGRSGTLYGDDYASLEEAQKLAHAYSIALLVIHHTGKESREDPLDEVNATQGLNGVADNVLVLRRERGKPTATLIGDGRELNDIERALAFDLSAGGWRVTEAPADQPKTPERVEILELLKASETPMSPKQIADALGKNGATIRNLLAKMVQAGEVKMKTFGKYIPVDDIDNVDSSSLKEEEKQYHSFCDEKEHTTEVKASTLSMSSTGERESAAATVQEAGDATPPDEPPADFQRFVGMVARVTNSRVAEYSRIATPDADDPSTLQPSGLRPASLAHAPQGKLWPVAGACTGVFCAGACVCGEHLCDACGCEAGALVDNHPWYDDRREARRGSICAYCFAPATVASRWKTPLCERCWQIASRGQGIDPSRYQPRPFGPIPGDEEDFGE